MCWASRLSNFAVTLRDSGLNGSVLWLIAHLSPAVGMCHSRDSSGSLWVLYFLSMGSHLQSESRTSAAGFRHRSRLSVVVILRLICADPALCGQLIWIYETSCLGKQVKTATCTAFNKDNSRKPSSLLSHTNRPGLNTVLANASSKEQQDTYLDTTSTLLLLSSLNPASWSWSTSLCLLRFISFNT